MAVHKSNPHDPVLLNNLAVIHAYMGNTSRAQDFINRSKTMFEPQLTVTQKATEGLIKFRSGSFNEGLLLYEAAISSALEKKQYTTALRAYCFLGREMARLSAEWAESFGKEIDRTIGKLRRRNVPIPRDVEIIRALYSESIPQDFGPLSLSAPSLSEAIN